MRFATTIVSALAVMSLVGASASAAPKGGGGKAGKDMDFEPDNAAAGEASATLQRAIKLYDKKDWFSASIELQKVLDKESGDDARNVQRAEFFMGKTLYQMNFYAASLTYFDKIVQAGDQHTYHGAALK